MTTDKIFEVRHIDFETLKKWWIKTDHFKVPDKQYNRIVTKLGPYRSLITEPRVFEYGLFDGEKHIGVTQLQEWDEETVRWRTINVLPEYRGEDLAWFMLREAWKKDWQEYPYFMGWFVMQYVPWTEKYGFKRFDDKEPYNDHVMVKQNMHDYYK